MLIDGFTVVAQIVNFLILLFLLNRFLYKPILKAIDQRQAQMETRWQAAEAEQEKAQAEAETHRQARQRLEEQREDLLAQAKAEADEMRQAELKQAREQVAQRRQEWQAALDNEQERAIAELRQQIGQQVIAIARRVLQDLAQADLEQQVIKTFQQKLYDLDDETRQALRQALMDAEKPITVQTGQELAESSRAALHQTLRETSLLKEQPLHFEVSPDLIVGIRLQTDHYDLAWTVADYLRDLETAIAQPTPS